MILHRCDVYLLLIHVFLLVVFSSHQRDLLSARDTYDDSYDVSHGAKHDFVCVISSNVCVFLISVDSYGASHGASHGASCGVLHGASRDASHDFVCVISLIFYVLVI